MDPQLAKITELIMKGVEIMYTFEDLMAENQKMLEEMYANLTSK